MTAIVDLLDRWKGESLVLKVNGQVIYQSGYNWCQKTFQHLCVSNGVKICGVADYPDKMGVRISGEVMDNAAEIKVEIMGGFDPNTCLDASFGIENIQIELK